MKNKLGKFIPILSFVALYPFTAFAAVPCSLVPNRLDFALCRIGEILGAILPILVALGVIYFVWGVVQYVIADGEEAKTKGKDRIIYGVIGLAVIVGLWGLVTILGDTFGVGGESAPDLSGLITVPASSTGCSIGTGLQAILIYFTCIIGKSVIPFLFAVAVVMFIWGAIKFFIIQASEEAKREQGKQFMIWGVIALTVMIGIWGLVKIVGGTVGIDTTFLPQVKP